MNISEIVLRLKTLEYSAWFIYINSKKTEKKSFFNNIHQEISAENDFLITSISREYSLTLYPNHIDLVNLSDKEDLIDQVRYLLAAADVLAEKEDINKAIKTVINSLSKVLAHLST